jgi:hypothetical protein
MRNISVVSADEEDAAAVDNADATVVQSTCSVILTLPVPVLERIFAFLARTHFAHFATSCKLLAQVARRVACQDLIVLHTNAHKIAFDPRVLRLKVVVDQIAHLAPLTKRWGSRLTNLHLNNFNQPLSPGIIPSSVTCLEFGFQFDYPLHRHVLPPGLLELFVGAKFNQPLGIDVLPPRLLKLDLGEAYTCQLMAGALPSSLTYLRLSTAYNSPLGIRAGVLPDSLTHLQFGSRFNQPLQLIAFPDYLSSLSFGRDFNQPLGRDVLPPSLTHLLLGASFNQPLPTGTLPVTLLVLRFGVSFNQPLSELPPHLCRLIFGRDFNQPLDHVLGSLHDLTHLIFDSQSKYNHPLAVLPRTLTHLQFGRRSRFRQVHPHLVIPPSVIVLILPSSLAQSDSKMIDHPQS